MSFLREVESPYDVQDYVKSYLGDTPRSAQFAKDFLEKRSSASRQKQRHDDEVCLVQEPQEPSLLISCKLFFNSRARISYYCILPKGCQLIEAGTVNC